MNRRYRPLRLTPEQAGELQHSYDRLQASAAQTNAELKALEETLRATYGFDTYRKLRAQARDNLLAQQLKQEIAA